MKEPEDMTVAELRTELRAMGVTEKLMSLVLREMAAAEQRIQKAGRRDDGGRYDPLRAQLFVLKQNGMANPDLSLNRKGRLFITLTTKEQVEQAA